MYFAFNNNLIERFELHNYNIFLINREDVIKIAFLFFIYKIYYNWLTNLKISYFFKNVHPHFMEQMYHVMLSLNYYISLQL